MEISIRDLAPERVEDFFRFFEQIAFAENPEWGCDCFCCFFHAQSKKDWEDRCRADNRREARRMILEGRMRGLFAYEGDKPVGWCHFDMLKNLPGAHIFYPDLAGADEKGAAIVCFTIAQGYRGQGIATKLLETALARLRDLGARRVEAYPVLNDPSQEHNYLGPLKMYEDQGFRVVKRTEHQALVEKEL